MPAPNPESADPARLLAGLDQIEAACRDERWEDAERLLQEHDRSVRAVPASAWDVDTLNALLQRQLALAELMTSERAKASTELGQLGASRRGAKAYQG